MWEKHKVILLPTRESYLVVGKRESQKSKYWFFPTRKMIKEDEQVQPQHLYILSDEEIKEGDFYMWTGNKAISKLLASDIEFINHHSIDIKKIISSTDKSLGLPEPSIEFLQEWVNNPQEEIEIEYRCCGMIANAADCCNKSVILINWPYNTINCRFIEDSWEDLKREFATVMRKNTGLEVDIYALGNLNAAYRVWLEENYEVPKKLNK